jgi:hypothetical protein
VRPPSKSRKSESSPVIAASPKRAGRASFTCGRNRIDLREVGACAEGNACARTEAVQHDLAPYDGVLDYSGASGATDTVAGSDSSASGSAPPPAAALQLFIGTGQIFLSLGASTFPIVQGLETESATETANASATVELTYDYTPAQSVPEPRTLALGMIGVAGLLGMRRWRASRGRASAPAREPSASGAA